MPKKLKPFEDPRPLLDTVLDLAYFDTSDGPAVIPAHRLDGESKLVLVTGDNAGGKSFFRRLITLLCYEAKYEVMAISVQGRCTSSPARPFIYGSEEWESTGQNSANTVTTGISTCRGRTTPHVIFWDEPDIGLSDSWAAGVGVKIAEFARNTPEMTKAAFVVTHSKPLVRQLVDAKPTFIHLGAEDPPKTIEEWLDAPVVPRDPADLPKLSRERFLAIKKVLDRNKP